MMGKKPGVFPHHNDTSYLSFEFLVFASTLMTVWAASPLVVTVTELPAFRSSNLQGLPSQESVASAGMKWVCWFLPSLSVIVSCPFSALTILPSWTLFSAAASGLLITTPSTNATTSNPKHLDNMKFSLHCVLLRESQKQQA